MKADSTAPVIKKSYFYLITISVSLVIFVGAIFYIESERSNEKNSKISEIKSVTDLKAKQISDWFAERIADAQVITESPVIIASTKSFIKNRQSRLLKRDLAERLDLITKHYNFEKIFFTTSKGEVILHSGNDGSINQITKSFIINSMTENKPVISDFYICPIHKKLHLDIVVPIIDNEGRIIAALVLLYNPEDFLLPVVNFWPSALSTVESMILKKEGDSVRILNEPKHSKKRKTGLSFPLTNNSSPSVKTILGNTGVLEGIDYSGTEVFAYSTPIKNTPWYLISLIDKNEVYKRLTYITLLILLYTGTLISLISFIMISIYRKKQNELAMQLTVKERNLREGAERYKNLVENAVLGVYRTTPDGKVSMVNQALCNMLGFSSPEELLNRNLNYEGFENESQRENFLNEIYKNGVVIGFESKWTTKDNRVIYVSENAKLFHDEFTSQLFFEGTVEDISQRKLAEEALRKSEIRFSSVWDNSISGMRLTNMDGQIILVNEAYCTLVKLPSDKLIGKPLSIVFSSETREKNMHSFLKNVKNSTVEAFTEKEVILWNLDHIWVSVASSIIDNKVDSPMVLTVFNDITEKKISEENLRKSEEQFRFAMEASNDGVWDWNVSTGEVYYSPSYWKMLGYEPSECLPVIQSWLDNIHPDDRELAYKKNLECITNKLDSFQIEYRMIKKSGDFVWIQGSGKAVNRDKSGIATRLVGTHINITKMKEVEISLRQSEERFRSLFENMLDGFALHEILLDENNIPCNYKFLEINPAFERMTGLKGTDLLGKSVLEIMPETENYWIETYGNVAITGEPVRFENFSKELGKYFEVIAYSPQKYSFATIFRDVTERKRYETALHNAKLNAENSEKKFKSYFNSTQDGVFIADSLGNYTEVNPGASKITGYSAEELYSLNLLDLIPEEDKAIAAASFQDLKVKGINEVELHFRKKDGSLGYWIVSAVKLAEDRYLAFVKDITERRSIEMELEKHKKNLEELVRARTDELNKLNYNLALEIEERIKTEVKLKHSLEKEIELSTLKSQFISTASHEFRTPLAIILSSTDLIQRYHHRWKPEKLQDHLGRIKESVAYLTRLMDNVSTLNRAESGNIIFKQTLTDLKQLCSRIIEDSQININHNHIFTLEYNAELESYFLDPHQIQTILHNLISNGSKYSPAGGEVSLNVSSNDDIIIMSVSDSGIGIQEEDKKHLFEPFFRSDKVESIQGTGLGLSIVKKAVELHKGIITVNSVLGKGTTFTVKIPIVKRELLH